MIPLIRTSKETTMPWWRCKNSHIRKIVYPLNSLEQLTSNQMWPVSSIIQCLFSQHFFIMFRIGFPGQQAKYALRVQIIYSKD